MIQILLKGGLGNQMFEYAYALKVSRAHGNEKMCINGSFLKYSPDKRKIALGNLALADDTEILPILPHPLAVIRTFSLIFKYFSEFGLSAFVGRILVFSQMMATNKKWSFLQSSGFVSLIEKLHTRLSAKGHTPSGNEADYTGIFQRGLYYVRDYYQSPPIVPSTAANKYVWGLFQHISTIEGIEDELRKRFAVRTEASEANKKILEEIKSCNGVCLHIRRGDYLSQAFVNTLCVCDERYYVEAVHQAHEQLDNPVFFCFSNDHESIEWIKQNYHFPSVDIRYVDLDNPDYEELRLMTACKHFIISNSTFSWWAAVLSDEHPQKRVWVPKTWIKGRNVTLYKDSWTTL